MIPLQVLWCRVVVLCVWCVCVLRHAEKKTWKKRVWIQKRLRVHIQNVPVYAGTTRTCVSTCTRGAGTHGGSRGSSSVLLTKICPRTVITCFRGSPKKLLDLSHFQV